MAVAPIPPAEGKASRRGEMPETVSLKEVLRKAIEDDDKREREPVLIVSNIEALPIVEANEPVDMTFVEQAGQLIPWEGK